MKTILRPWYHRAFRLGLKLRWWTDRGGVGPDGIPLPPARLRYKVSENNDLQDFLTVGEKSAEALEAALNGLGSSFAQPLTVLDFGCGCGRALRWMLARFPQVMFFATDTDAEAIAWCRANLKATFWQNQPEPPLPAHDGQFDVIYAISVFTHLDERHQKAWLAELARITKPGGWVLLSVYGEHIWKARREATRVIEHGFVFETSTKHEGILPDWYHTAFQSRERIVGNAGAHFAEVRYIPRGFGDHDLVAARKG